MSTAKVSLPNEYTRAPLNVAHILFKISIAGPSSAIEIFNVNLLSLILVPAGEPSNVFLIPVKLFLGLCLNVPSACPSTP